MRTLEDDIRALLRGQARAMTVPEPPEMRGRPDTRVQGSTQRTEEEVIMVDLDSPSRAAARAPRTRHVPVEWLLAAAAAVAVVLVATTRNDTSTTADQPSLAIPQGALFDAPEEQLLSPGTYFVDEIAGVPTPRISLTLGEGWFSSDNGWTIDNDSVGKLQLTIPQRVYRDACHLSAGFYPGPLTTVDGLVTALSKQGGGWTDSTRPLDVIAGDHAGKAFQRTARDDFSTCDNPRYIVSWKDNVPDGGWTGYEPGDTEILRVFDLDGTIILISTRLPAGGYDADALAAVLDSISIEQT